VNDGQEEGDEEEKGKNGNLDSGSAVAAVDPSEGDWGDGGGEKKADNRAHPMNVGCCCCTLLSSSTITWKPFLANYGG
jgi:hypothetical protein